MPTSWEILLTTSTQRGLRKLYYFILLERMLVCIKHLRQSLIYKACAKFMRMGARELFLAHRAGMIQLKYLI